MALETDTQKVATWDFSWVPSFDGQTIVTFVVGTLITLFIFWRQNRQAVTASHERGRNASSEILQACITRIAVERQLIPYDMFKSINSTKCKKFNVPFSFVISYDDCLDAIVSETVENKYLDGTGKEVILNLVKGSRIHERSAEDEVIDNERMIWLSAKRGIFDRTFPIVALAATTIMMPLALIDILSSVKEPVIDLTFREKIIKVFGEDLEKPVIMLILVAAMVMMVAVLIPILGDWKKRAERRSTLSSADPSDL